MPCFFCGLGLDSVIYSEYCTIFFEVIDIFYIKWYNNWDINPFPLFKEKDSAQ